MYFFCICVFLTYFVVLEILNSSFSIVQELDPLITSNDVFIDLVGVGKKCISSWLDGSNVGIFELGIDRLEK